MTEVLDHYLRRQNHLQMKMQELQIHGFLVNHYLDIFYYTGSMQSGYLFIPVVGDAIFFVRRSVERAKVESYFEVEMLLSVKQLYELLCTRFPTLMANHSRIATEFDVLPVQIFRRLESAIPQVEWVDGSQLIREQRMIKSFTEVESIRKAASVIDETLELAISYVRVGMSELELLAYIEYELRKRGHLGVMRMRTYNSEIFTGFVASGAEAAIPSYFDGPAGGLGLHPAHPQGSSHALIRSGEPLLVDIGCTIDGYLIDQSRTLVIGELHPKLLKAYHVAEEILLAIEARLKPGTICEDLYLLALAYADKAELSDHFMGYTQNQVKFVGHGIGLEIDELPILAKGHRYPLQAGMVIAIEPKFTFPQEGVVGIENTYLIHQTGFEKLTISRQGILVIPC